MQAEAPKINLVLIGEPEVGKTSLLLYWRNPADNFDSRYFTTIAHDFEQKSHEVSCKKYQLNIIDASGLQNYVYMNEPHLKKAHGVVVMFDMTNKHSFTKALHWIQLAKKTAPKDTEYLLVGNKTDLEDKREVTREEGAEFARSHGMNYVEISARNRTNLGGVLSDLVPRAIKVQEKRPSESVSWWQKIKRVFSRD